MRAARPRPARAAARAAASARSELGAVAQRHAGGLERGPQPRRLLADQVRRRAALGDRGGQRRVVLLLAATAEDRVHAARERADPDDRRRHVRRLGVVDVEHAVDPRDLLEPMRHPGEARQRGADRGGRDAARERDRGGRHRVLEVVRPPQPDLVDRDDRLAAPGDPPVLDRELRRRASLRARRRPSGRFRRMSPGESPGSSGGRIGDANSTRRAGPPWSKPAGTIASASGSWLAKIRSLASR